MSITPANVSMLLALLSSIAPGTLAVVAGILGAAIGFFGKKYLKQNDCPTCSNDSSPSGKVSRRNSSSRTSNSGSGKASSSTRRD